MTKVNFVGLVANGFLPTRGSWVLDSVFVGMFLICVLMMISIAIVRYRKRFALHRSLQLSLAVILALAIVIFEVDIRFITDWRSLARQSAYYGNGIVDSALWVHLCFAIPTPFVWGYVVVSALRNFPSTLGPSSYSRKHRFWGRIAAVLMLMTAATGCVFYWLAFAC